MESSMYVALETWEKRGLQEEISVHEGAVAGTKHVRMNCTFRWHRCMARGCCVELHKMCQKECRKRCQTECRKECQTECFGHV